MTLSIGQVPPVCLNVLYCYHHYYHKHQTLKRFLLSLYRPGADGRKEKPARELKKKKTRKQRRKTRTNENHTRNNQNFASMAKPSVPPFFLLTCFLSCVAAQEAVRRPNILFVLMDDLGYNDVGYRDSQFHTPFIDELHSNAVRFDSSYTPPNCGASRAALLSGVYPHKLGLQVPATLTFQRSKLNTQPGCTNVKNVTMFPSC